MCPHLSANYVSSCPPNMAQVSVWAGNLQLFALNLNNGKLVGSIVTFVIHFLGYVMISDTSLGIPLKFSPLANTILQWHSREMPLYFSYRMFFIAILIIMMILRITVFHTDFKISVSGK